MSLGVRCLTMAADCLDKVPTPSLKSGTLGRAIGPTNEKAPPSLEGPSVVHRSAQSLARNQFPTINLVVTVPLVERIWIWYNPFSNMLAGTSMFIGTSANT